MLSVYCVIAAVMSIASNRFLKFHECCSSKVGLVGEASEQKNKYPPEFPVRAFLRAFHFFNLDCTVHAIDARRKKGKFYYYTTATSGGHGHVRSSKLRLRVSQSLVY